MSNSTTIMGNGGRVLGYVQTNGNSKLYYTPSMRLVARVITEGRTTRTYTGQSQFIGYGDLGALQLK